MSVHKYATVDSEGYKTIHLIFDSVTADST
jgi:hypothetical protein